MLNCERRNCLRCNKFTPEKCEYLKILNYNYFLGIRKEFFRNGMLKFDLQPKTKKITTNSIMNAHFIHNYIRINCNRLLLLLFSFALHNLDNLPLTLLRRWRREEKRNKCIAEKNGIKICRLFWWLIALHQNKFIHLCPKTSQSTHPTFRPIWVAFFSMPMIKDAKKKYCVKN